MVVAVVALVVVAVTHRCRSRYRLACTKDSSTLPLVELLVNNDYPHISHTLIQYILSSPRSIHPLTPSLNTPSFNTPFLNTLMPSFYHCSHPLPPQLTHPTTHPLTRLLTHPSTHPPSHTPTHPSIPAVFVINLDRRPDRWRTMLRECDLGGSTPTSIYQCVCIIIYIVYFHKYIS